MPLISSQASMNWTPTSTDIEPLIMKHLIGILLFSISVSSFAQPISDLVIYTTEPDPFYLILNGVKQNDQPMTNVRVTDLNQPVYDARIVFDSDKAQIDKKIYFAEPGMEYVYKVTEKRNGELTIRIQSATALNLAPAPPANQQVVVYHATPSQAPVSQTVTTTTTTSSVTQSNSLNNGGVNMSVGVPGFNMNVNVNDPFLADQPSSITVHESVTTTTSVAPMSNTRANHYVMQGYNGPIGCPWPMDENEFSNAERSIGSKTFSDSKMTMAKQVTGANCLTADQVKRIMMQFDFENDKLEYAKFAYNKTFDIGNYYRLNDAFDFESSIDELDAFINGH